jgi:peroxiredoxin Q/BCP
MDVGSRAPDFEAVAHTGERVRLSDFRGRIVVLYFFPRAMTPGCTREGIRFNELLPEFERLGAVVIGASTDTVERQRKFASKHGFRFLLISDPEGLVAKAYGVLRRGTRRMSAERVTFVIGRDGIIKAIIRGVRPAERHADEALKIVRELSKGEQS